MTTIKQRLARKVCLALIAAGLPLAAANAAPQDAAQDAAVDLPPPSPGPCVAFADIGKTWFIDNRSILLKVREAGRTRYKAIEFKDNLPAGLRDRDFRFVRHSSADTDDPTHVCVSYKVSGIDTAVESGPIAAIVDVDIRQATRLVKRPERLAAHPNDNWMNLDRAQSDAFYLWSAQMNAPPPGPPPSPPQR